MKQQIQSSTPAEQAPTIPTARCIGWAVDSDHILVQCPEMFTPAHANGKYHSKACYEWTWHRRGDGFALGDSYVKGQHTKRHPPKPCQKGWTIRDGVIAPCTEPFTRGRTDKQYHSSACFFQTRRWRKIGYHLGDSVRRTCAYRNCKKGADGNRGRFDQIHRSLKSGDYFCDPRCKAAENRAREADRVAKLEAQAAQAQQQPRAPGRPKDEETDKKIELMAKLSLQGKSLRAMSAEVYPERKHSPAVAYNNVRWLASNYRAQFEAAKRRLQGA